MNAIKCNRIDHYTLIVPDSKAVSDFHSDVLGYPFLEIKEVNAGSVPQGQYDMINYIHEWPDGSGRILVITEGLTDESIFRRFMAKYGQGIHHVALQVDDLDEAWATLQANCIKLTSGHIMFDFLSGLKQVFLDNADTGVFIELIERNKSDDMEVDATEKGFFAHDNMAGLAGTMSDYISDVASAADTSTKQNTAKATGKISGIRLNEFVLEVTDPEVTASFFENIFGFARASQANENGIRIFLETEPDLSFLCTKKTEELMHHSLVCKANFEDDYLAEVEKETGANMLFSNNKLKIGSALTGYPMTLIPA